MELLQFAKEDRQLRSNKDTTLQNLVNHMPAEATALYIAGLDAVGNDATPLALIIVAVVALPVLLLVRILAKASTAVMISSIIAFIIWVYALGNGPFQALNLSFTPGIGAFLVIVYSTIITILANKGIIK